MSELTAKDLHWFRIANAGHPPGFYPFKDRFLKRFGTLVGYCIQTIDHTCWTCEGDGSYGPTELCRKCNGTGIYRQSEQWLECWTLQNAVFHRPVPPPAHFYRPELTMWPPIVGRVQHEPVAQSVARRCFYRLLLRHEPVAFYHQVCSDIQARIVSGRLAWRWRLIRLRNKLDLFPAVEDTSVPF